MIDPHHRNASSAPLAVPLALAVSIALGADASWASNCGGTSTGLTPLIDFSPGQTYYGFTGRLYPGESNHRPESHNAAGVAIAQSIAPLDTLGDPDPQGRVVLISIGMSNATQEFSAFVPESNVDPLRQPHAVAVDCAKGGQATQDIRLPTAAYWDTVFTRLRGHGSSPRQAQVVWLKEARRGPTEGFPAATESLVADLGRIARIIHQKLPNVRLCYLTSRIYAGYASSSLNPEPYAYESGFAVKWLIEAQIAGVDSLSYDPRVGPVGSPWLAWGPYLWSDGLAGRSDGMIWRCDEFQSDGTHPSASGRDVVADSLLAFFREDETTAPWYRVTAPAAVDGRHGGRASLAVEPNPARAVGGVRFVMPEGGARRIDVLDVAGRRVRSLVSDGAEPAISWDGRDESGSTAGAGVYWARATGPAGVVTRRFVMLP